MQLQVADVLGRACCVDAIAWIDRISDLLNDVWQRSQVITVVIFGYEVLQTGVMFMQRECDEVCMWLNAIMVLGQVLFVLCMLLPAARVTGVAYDTVLAKLLEMQKGTKDQDDHQAQDIALLIQFADKLDMGYKLFEVFPVSWMTLKTLFTAAFAVLVTVQNLHSLGLRI